MPILNTGIFKSATYAEMLSSSIALNYLKKYERSCINIDKSINVSIINWYPISFSKLERYIVCKCKSIQDNTIIYFVFNFYSHFMCSKDNIDSSKMLTDIKNNITNYKNGECILFDNMKILKIDHDYKEYYNFETPNNNVDHYEQLYLFKTIYKINKKSEYNHNFNDYRWFFALNNINPAGCYTVNLKYCKTFETKNNNSYMLDSKTYFCDDAKLIFSTEISHQQCKISRMSFDIECKHLGSFPSAKQMPISHICIEMFFDDDTNKILDLVNVDIINCKKPIINNLTLDEIDKYVFKKETITSVYSSEINILNIFQRVLLLDFDYVLSFNGHEFDIPYINERRSILGLLPLQMSNILGKTDLVLQNSYSSKIEHSQFFLDMMKYTKNEYKLPSYSLNAICKSKFVIQATVQKCSKHDVSCYTLTPQKCSNLSTFYKVLSTANYCFVNDTPYELNKVIDNSKLYDKNYFNSIIGEPFCVKLTTNITSNSTVTVTVAKDDVDIGDKNIYKNNYSISTAKRIAKYCIHDTVLCNRLFEADLVHNKVSAFSYQYLLPQNQVYSYKSSTNSAGQLLLVLLDQHTFFKTHISNKDKYEGATVFKPKHKYISKPVILLDYTSLYPTIMRECNLSPETIEKVIISDDKIMNLKIEHYLSKTYLFPDYIYIKLNHNNIYTYIVSNRKKKGIIPIILEKGMNQRNMYKQKMKSAKTIEESQMYDSMQYAIKIFINSIYGIMASYSFMFSNIYCAQFCTGMGRACIAYTYDLLNNSINNIGILRLNQVNNLFTNEPVNTEYKSNIQHYFELEVVYGDTDSVFLAVNKLCIADNVTLCNLCKNIGEVVSNVISNSDLFPKLFNLEFGGLMRWIVLISKKKYITECVTKFNPLEMTIHTKGTSLIRRDYSLFHKHHYNQIINIIQKSMRSHTSNVRLEIINYLKCEVANIINNLDSINLNDFIETTSYTDNYKDPNNPNKTTVLAYNKNNPQNPIHKNDRYSFVHGIYVESIDKSWNPKYSVDISKKKIIINDYETKKIRICIEKYVEKLINDVNNLLEDDSISLSLFKTL